MSKLRSDGSVQSTNTPLNENTFQDMDFKIYKVLLTRIFYTDDRDNVSRGGQNPEVMYDGLILGGKREGQTLSNIRDAINLTGGKDNYGERIYRTNTFPVTGTGKVDINKQDGDLVYVALMQGNPAYPLIVGRATGVLDGDKTGATRSDGPRFRWEYNGIFFEVDKNGEMTLTRKGGQFQEKEGFFATAEDGDKVTFSLTNSKLTTTFAVTQIIKVEDGTTERVEWTFGSGLRVLYSGLEDKVEILTTGTAKALIDGKSGTIELKDNGTGKLKITGDKVALGASSAELLQQISDALGKIITWANDVGALHTHIGNLGYPTAVPDNTTDYIQLGTDLTTIKDLVDGIKGTL